MGADVAMPAARPKRWRRRIWRGFLVLVGLIVAVRLALPWIAPFVLSKIAAGFGLEARFDRLEVALLHGEVGLSGLVVRDPDRAMDVARVGFVRARISWLDLLVGRLRLYRVDLDDLAVHVERDQDGRWSWLERFRASEPAAAPVAETPEAAPAPEEHAAAVPLPRLAEILALPLRVDDVRLHRARLHWRDAYGSEPLAVELQVAVRAHHLGYDDNELTTVDVEVAAAPGLEKLKLDLRAALTQDALRSEVAFDLAGFDAATFRRYLEPLGIEPPETRVGCGVRFSALLHDDAESFLHGLVEIEDLAYREGAERPVHLDRVSIQTRSIGASDLSLEQIEVTGFGGALAREANGALRIGGWRIAPAQEQRELAIAEAPAPPPPPASNEPRGPTPASAGTPTRFELWPAHLPRLRVGALQIRDGSFLYADRQRDCDVAFELERIELKKLDTRPERGAAPAELVVRAALPGHVGKIAVDGTVAPDRDLAHLELALELGALQPQALDALLEVLGIEGLGIEAERVRFALAADLDPQDSSSTRLDAAVRELAIEGAGGAPLLRLDLARADLRFGAEDRALVVERVELAGLTGKAVRSRDGALHVGGVRLGSKETVPALIAEAPAGPAQRAEESPIAAESPRTPREPVPALASSGAPGGLLVRAIAIRGVALTFADEMQVIPEPLELADLSLSLADLQLTAGALDVAPARLELRAALPGTIEQLELAGDLLADSKQPRFDLALDARGLTARRVAVLLERAGVRTELVDGTLHLKFRGELALDGDVVRAPRVEIERLELADGERELFALHAARIEDLRIGAQPSGAPRIDVARASWERCRTALELREGQSIAALGFAVGGPNAAPPPASTSSEPVPAPGNGGEPSAQAGADPQGAVPEAVASDAPPAGEPAFHCAELDLAAIEVAITDLRGDRWPIEISIAGKDLAFAAGAGERAPGELEVRARVADTLEELSLKSSFRAAPELLELEASLASRGIDLAKLGPALQAVGFEGAMRSGTATVALEARVERRDGGLDARFRVRDLSVKDGEREWLGLDALQAEGLRFERDRTALGMWTLDAPRAEVDVLPDGRPVALGLILGTPPIAELAAAEASAAEAPVVEAPVVQAPAVEGVEPAAPLAGEAAAEASAEAPLAVATKPPLAPPSNTAQGRVEIEGFALRGGRFLIVDRRGAEPVELPVQIAASLGALAYGAERGEAPLELELTALPRESRLRASGVFGATLDSAAFTLGVEARALDLSRVQAFLPRELQARTHGGELDAALSGELQRDDASGDLALRFTARDVRWAEHGAEHPWIGFRTLEIAAQLLAEQHAIAIDRVACEGLRGTFENDRGTLRALGFELAPATSETPAVAAAPEALLAEDRAVHRAENATSPPTAAEPSIAAWEPARAAALPRIAIKELVIDIEDLRWIDHAADGREGRGVVALKLWNTQPIDCLGKHFAEREPILLRAEGRVSPGVEYFRLDLETNPFSPQPHFELAVSSHGIDGPALRAAAPALLPSLSDDGLVGASLDGRFEAELKFPRRGPLDFSLDRRFGLLFSVQELALRDAEGRILAGMDALFLEAPRIELQRGYVAIRRLDLTKPEFHAVRTARGWEAFGWVLDAEPASNAAPTSPAAPAAPAAQAAPATANAEELAASSSSSAPRAASNAPAAAPASPPFVIEIAALQVFDGLASLRDETVDPPLFVPLHSIDLAVQNLSSAPTEDSLPIGIQLDLLASDVDLPKRSASAIPGASFVTGVFGGLAETVTGPARPNLEPRPLLQEFHAEALLTPSWPPRGHIGLDLQGFEMSSLTSTAKRSSIQLNDGLLDARVNVSVDRGFARGRNLLYFTNLDVDEPAGGPIQSYLRLPAALDVVLFALIDDSGAVRVPVDFDQSLGAEMTEGEVLSIAIDSLGRSLSHAVERSAFRVVGFVTDFGESVIGSVPLIGDVWNFFFSSAIPAEVLAPIEIDFAPGDTFLSQVNDERLAEALERLDSYGRLDLAIEHRSGTLDFARAKFLGSPSRTDLLAVGARLDHEMEIVSRSREVLLAQAEAAILADRPADSASARAALRESNERLGELMEQKRTLFDWLGERRESQSDRRTRDMQIEFARARAEVVKKALIARSGTLELGQRLRVPRPRPNTPDFEGGAKIVLRPVLRTR